MVDEQVWRIAETADYLCGRGYTTVTLQFPDALLPSAAGVAVALHDACAARGHAVQAYILADTTYNPLSVDEVAAAHVDAQCVVHYGRASLTQLSRLPAYFVFPEEPLDVGAAAACLAGSELLAGAAAAARAGGGAPTRVLVFLDQPLLHQLEAFSVALAAAVEARHGRGAAACLLFPAVPQRHMEPQGRQAGAGAPPPRAGCCGGGCGGAAPQQPPAEQAQQAACCGGTAACQDGPDAQGKPPGSSSAAAVAAAAAEPAAEPAPAGVPAEAAAAADGGGALHSLAGYQWRLPPGAATRDCGLAWVGAPDAPALLQLQLTYSACRWALLDPSLLPAPGGGGGGGSGGGGDAPSAPAAALTEGLPLAISRALRRRYFLVQKARDASVVGVLVGTLGAAGYGDAVAALRMAAAAAGKKSYTLLVGKPSPAKLANFPEIEVFVLVADPQGQILDSKEYLAPIITPHEALLAWGSDADPADSWDEAAYRLDFEEAATAGAAAAAAAAGAAAGGPRRRRPHFSLLAGGNVGGGWDCSDSGGSEDEGGDGEPGGGAPASALALHAQQALVVSAAPGGRRDLVEARSAADYFLHKRSWQGVEAPLVGAAPKAVEAAVEGRSGRAAGYVDEPSRQAAAAREQQQ